MRSMLIPGVIAWAMLGLVIGMIIFVRARSTIFPERYISVQVRALVLVLAALICVAASLVLVALMR